MNNIGILQGRVSPKSIDKLQVFPEKWQEELSAIRKLGFNYVELLDDKDGCLRSILKENDVFDQVYNNKLQCNSVCMDHLCDYSLLENEILFFKKIEELIKSIKRKNFKFVIPFFNKNILSGKNQLGSAIKKLAIYDKLLSKNNIYFSLEIDLPARIIKDEFKKFQFKNIGICYDTGNNIGRSANLYEEIRLLKNYINHIHIKDKKEDKNVRLRKDFKELQQAFKSLQEISYKDIFILETCISPDPATEARKNLVTTKEYINKIY